MGTEWRTISRVGLAALALASGGAAAAQVSPGGRSVANLLISAVQNGRTVSTTRTDARGGFRFDLPVGTYEVCTGDAAGGTRLAREGSTEILIGTAVARPAEMAPGASNDPSTRQALPDRGPRIPGNGGRAGGQNLAAGGCFPYTVALPDGAGSTRSEPIPVPIRQPDGTIIYALAGMRTNDAPGGGSGPVRTLPPLPAQAATGGGVQVATGDVNGDGRADADTRTSPGGRGGQRVDPRIPPPAVAPRTVPVIGTLSLER